MTAAHCEALPNKKLHIRAILASSVGSGNVWRSSTIWPDVVEEGGSEGLQETLKLRRWEAAELELGHSAHEGPQCWKRGSLNKVSTLTEERTL